MAEIGFFSPMRLNTDYTIKSSEASAKVTFGARTFTLERVECVYDTFPNGKLDFVGYNEIYSNPEISQAEADALMDQYRKETGQIR